jgi:hypothetical protein
MFGFHAGEGCVGGSWIIGDLLTSLLFSAHIIMDSWPKCFDDAMFLSHDLDDSSSLLYVFLVHEGAISTFDKDTGILFGCGVFYLHPYYDKSLSSRDGQATLGSLFGPSPAILDECSCLLFLSYCQLLLLMDFCVFTLHSSLGGEGNVLGCGTSCIPLMVSVC